MWRQLGLRCLVVGCPSYPISDHHLGMGVKGCDLLVVWFVGSTWKVGECILVTGDIYTHFIYEAKRQDPYVLLKLSCHAHPEIVCNSDKEVTSLS